MFLQNSWFLVIKIPLIEYHTNHQRIPSLLKKKKKIRHNKAARSSRNPAYTELRKPWVPAQYKTTWIRPAFSERRLSLPALLSICSSVPKGWALGRCYGLADLHKIMQAGELKLHIFWKNTLFCPCGSAKKILVLLTMNNPFIIQAFRRDFYPHKPSTLTDSFWTLDGKCSSGRKENSSIACILPDPRQDANFRALKLAGKYPKGLIAVLHHIQPHLSNSLEENSSLFFKNIFLSL